MKAPQRNFVVEIKSSRRRLKSANTSIWGDTDLKALSREIDTRIPPAPEVQAVETLVSVADLPAAAPAATVVAHDESLDHFVLDVGNAGKGTISPRPRTYRRALTSGAAKRPMPGAGLNDTQPVLSERAVSIDELTLLDAENRRLKELLAEQLRAENRLLRQMSDRDFIVAS